MSKNAQPNFVTRYVVTHLNRDGMRTMIGPAQGRLTFATPEEAETFRQGILTNNSVATLGKWGAPVEVRPCPCWPGHFDPQTVWFDA